MLLIFNLAKQHETAHYSYSNPYVKNSHKTEHGFICKFLYFLLFFLYILKIFKIVYL